jgi:hypothetical protein
LKCKRNHQVDERAISEQQTNGGGKRSLDERYTQLYLLKISMDFGKVYHLQKSNLHSEKRESSNFDGEVEFKGERL